MESPELRYIISQQLIRSDSSFVLTRPGERLTGVGFGQKCGVARSSHGYTYAVCSVQAANVPSGQTVTLSYRSSLQTFKPRTNVQWGGTTGTTPTTTGGTATSEATSTGSAPTTTPPPTPTVTTAVG